LKLLKLVYYIYKQKLLQIIIDVFFTSLVKKNLKQVVYMDENKQRIGFFSYKANIIIDHAVIKKPYYK